MLAAQARSEAFAAARQGAVPASRVRYRYRVRYRLHPTARIALSGLAVALALLLYVGERTAIVDLNYRLGAQKSALNAALVDNERLKLESSRLASLDRIEKEATTVLGMTRPEHTRYVALAGPPRATSVAGAGAGAGGAASNVGGRDLASLFKSMWSAFARAAAPGEDGR